MGLTIHYALTMAESDPDTVRDVVTNIHQLAKSLPFQEVGALIEYEGEQCKFDDRNAPDRWLKIQAGQYIDVPGHHLKVTPLHVIAFTAIPGDGCEPANVGLCRYPPFVQVDRPAKRRVATNLKGWSWSSFCKTQYASDPEAGGTANFLRCHLAVIALLDAIQSRDLAKVEVSDESGYWEHRDPRKLAETVGQWNEVIAAVAGQLKDAAGNLRLEAPITQFPNFEHLEAKGQEKLDKRPS